MRLASSPSLLPSAAALRAAGLAVTVAAALVGCQPTTPFDFVYTAWESSPVLMIGNVDGQSRRLRTLGGSVESSGQLAVSPDGERVAFVTPTVGAPGWDLRVLELDGGDEHLVAQAEEDFMLPAWSPDGEQLAYIAAAGSTLAYDVFRVSADGGAPTALGHVELPSWSAAACIAPQWSPDGKEIAFSAVERLEVVRVSDSEHRVLAGPVKDAIHCEPRWSPAGLSVAFTRIDPSRGALATVGRAGGTPTTITDLHDTLGAGLARWSPDGRALAYTDYSYGNSEWGVRTVALDGGKPVLLDDRNAHAPAWSPDGEQLLYVHFDEGAQLTLVPAKGGAPRSLGLEGASLDGTYATWLPEPIDLADE